MFSMKRAGCHLRQDPPDRMSRPSRTTSLGRPSGAVSSSRTGECGGRYGPRIPPPSSPGGPSSPPRRDGTRPKTTRGPWRARGAVRYRPASPPHQTSSRSTVSHRYDHGTNVPTQPQEPLSTEPPASCWVHRVEVEQVGTRTPGSGPSATAMFRPGMPHGPGPEPV